MRKTTTAAMLGAALLAAAALPALAQPGPGPGAGPGGGARGPAAMFDQVDANRDGRVSWEEGWGFVQQRFAAADRDHDGALTQEEMQAAWPMGGHRRGAGRNGPAGEAGQQAASSRRSYWQGAMFRALDANRDGRLTLEEVRPAAEARFRAFDANLDNVVSRDELPQPHRLHGGQGGGAPGTQPG